MYIQGEKSLYKGFLIVEHPEGTFKAYRSIDYYRTGIATYSAGFGSTAETIRAFIDVVGDSGYFTPELLSDMLAITDGYKDEPIPPG